MSYWILTTHIISIFPICVYILSWKIRKDMASVFMIFHTIFVVIFSILYHTHDVSGIDTSNINMNAWTFLDHSQSSVLVMTTILYGLRVRSPQFYIFSYIFSMLILIFFLFDYYEISVYFLSIVSSGAGIMKWRTIYRYFKFFYLISFLTIFCAICAIIFYVLANELKHIYYLIFHSLWHFFIFCTAGFGGILRFKLDQQLYPILRNRDSLYSNEMSIQEISSNQKNQV